MKATTADAQTRITAAIHTNPCKCSNSPYRQNGLWKRKNSRKLKKEKFIVLNLFPNYTQP